MPDVLAVVPIAGADKEFATGKNPLLGGRPLLSYTQQALSAAVRIDRSIVSTDSAHIAELARQAGFEVPFMRPAELSTAGNTLTDVLRHAVEWVIQSGKKPQWVAMFFVTYPFRLPQFIDSFIETVQSRQLDSAVAVLPERHAHWMLDEEGNPELVSDGVERAKAQKRLIYRELSGLVAMFKPELVLSDRLYGQQLGVIPVDNAWASVNIHDAGGWELAEYLAPHFLEQMQTAASVKR